MESVDVRNICELLKIQTRTLNRIADMYKKEESQRQNMYKRITLMERNISDIKQKLYLGGEKK